MRGRASTGPNRPCDRVTGSEMPRAIHNVSASRSKVNAQAARAPCGQATVIEPGLRDSRSLRAFGWAAPREGEPESHVSVDDAVRALDRPHGLVRCRVSRKPE